MQIPNVLEVKGIRVLTTKQIAELYEADLNTVRHNFRYNKDKYILGKHYIEVYGEELRRLKTSGEFIPSLKYAKSAYLWTEKGALLHAKSLNTDKAWQVYDYLVDYYFRAKEKEPEIPEKKESAKRVSRKIDISSEPEILKAIEKIRRDIICMDVLLEKCEKNTWESRYIDDKHEAAEIATLIAADFNTLLGLKPKILKEIEY